MSKFVRPISATDTSHEEGCVKNHEEGCVKNEYARKFYCVLKYFNTLTKDCIDQNNYGLADDASEKMQKVVAHKILNACVSKQGICGDKLLNSILDGTYRTFICGGRYVGKTEFLKLLYEHLHRFSKGQKKIYFVDVNTTFDPKEYTLENISNQEQIYSLMQKEFPYDNEDVIYLVDNFDQFCRDVLLKKYTLEQVIFFRTTCFNFFLNSVQPIFEVAVETNLFECFGDENGGMPEKYRVAIHDLNYAWPQLDEEQIIQIIVKSNREIFPQSTSEYRCTKNKCNCRCSFFFKGQKPYLNENTFLKEVINNSGNNPYWIFLPLSHSLNTDSNFIVENEKYCYDEWTVKQYYQGKTIPHAPSRKQDIIADYLETLPLYVDSNCINSTLIEEMNAYIINNFKTMEERDFDKSLTQFSTRPGGIGTAAIPKKTFKQFLLDSTIIIKKTINGKNLYEVHPFIKYIYSEVKKGA